MIGKRVLYDAKKVLSTAGLLLLLTVTGFGQNSPWETYGLWETKNGASPGVRIEIKRDNKTTVFINDRKKNMEYDAAVCRFNNVMHSFMEDLVAKSGSEEHHNICLIGGRLDSVPVLQGFYSVRYYNQEGIGVKTIFLPITLYRTKHYK
ncbi:MAG: hypothetical protein KBA61_10290 [Spirochaetes bacterium]|nr:hypothetical protein [Spirochaetota bacterium]